MRRAIKSGKPMPKSVIDQIMARYSDRLLKLRADTIALNETMSALNEAKMQAKSERKDRAPATVR